LAYVPADRARDACDLKASIKRNVMLVALGRIRSRWGTVPSKTEDSQARTWLQNVQLSTDDFERPMSSLSGGNQQKVVMAKWLMCEPKVLLLHEPTQGVDIGAKQEIFRIVGEAAAGGAGAIVCSTDPAELVQFCSRVLVLREGVACAEFEGAALSAPAISQEIYGATFDPAESI
jgi:ribose transport system ATP-binding protein